MSTSARAAPRPRRCWISCARTESNTLYLVGDMIDGWSLRQKWYWDQLHNDVIQKIMRKARKGTKVIFIPGKPR